MSKIDDMALFVQVVKSGGLAAAGRQLELSPASMTARVNALEQHYDTRLLQRTTRRISLTDAGNRFYEACLRVLAEVEQAEAALQSDKESLSGQLRITAPSDFGRQYVVPALADFVSQHPAVTPYLHLSDGVVNLIEYGYELGIRYGNLPDSDLIVRNLAENRRVLIASPNYLKKYGVPKHPSDLKQHQCLVGERRGEPLNKWQFKVKNKQLTIKVKPAFSCNDSSIIRLWALADKGIAYKSIWDVQQNIEKGDLQTILDDFVFGFITGDNEKTGLQIVYPNRRYLPVQVAGFVKFFKGYLQGQKVII
ncbi:MAG: LysR family transcriptional regulator [Cocleimonas sp.]